MEKSHFLGDWWFFMWFLVILSVGTGEPPPYCNKNTLGKLDQNLGLADPPPLSWDKIPNFSILPIWRLPLHAKHVLPLVKTKIPETFCLQPFFKFGLNMSNIARVQTFPDITILRHGVTAFFQRFSLVYIGLNVWINDPVLNCTGESGNHLSEHTFQQLRKKLKYWTTF